MNDMSLFFRCLDQAEDTSGVFQWRERQQIWQGSLFHPVAVCRRSNLSKCMVMSRALRTKSTIGLTGVAMHIAA